MRFQKLIGLGCLISTAVVWEVGAVELHEAEITTIKNIVERDEGAGAQPAKAADKIHENSKVTTAAASMAELTFADSSITRMGANTLFSFQSKERLIKLDKGTLLIHTPPGNGGATVDCGGVTAAVTGTTFMASRDSVGNAVFVLLEGSGGMKITVGGVSTTIRPGQAASVGSDSAKDSAGTSSDKAAPAAGKDSPGAGKEGDPSGGGANNPSGKGGGESGAAPAKGPAPAEAPPAPAKPPEIKVFEVDVKKIVQTTPLVTEFKRELPSAQKIEATIEVQQGRVQEGKLEKLDVEVVAVAHGDGDLLVGTPEVKKEDMKIVNSKEAVAEKGEGKLAERGPGDIPGAEGLDVATAAGSEAGAGSPPVAAAPSPKPTVAATPPPPAPPPPVNPAQVVIQPPEAPTTIAITARVNDATRLYNQENPPFGFSITAGNLLAGHSLVADFLTPATSTSAAGGSPYRINWVNPRIVDASGADVLSRYKLTTLAGVLNIQKASQNVNFTLPTTLTYNTGTGLSATALDSGTVSFSVVSGPATIDGRGQLVATSGTGSVVVRATAVGDQNYNGAFADQTITLAKAGQNVNFTLPTTLTYNTGTGLSATALDSGTVSFSVVSGPATIDGRGQLVATSGTGSVVVRATAVGDQNYNGAFADQTITLAKAGQNVNFTLPTTLTYNTGTGLSATALDSGTVSFSVVSGPATIDGRGQLVATSGTGSVVVRATAVGDQNYNGAFADQTITLAKAGQNVNFTLPTTLTYNTGTGLSATALDSGTVSFSVVSGPATIDGRGQLVATSGTGSVVVRATAVGDQNYNGAFADQTITLAKAGQNVNFTLPTTLTYNTGTGLSATALDSGTVSFSVVSGPATIDGRGQLVATSGTGSVVVRATAVGDQNYNGAFADQTITLAKAGQNVNFTLPTTLTYNTGTGLSATALDSGTVSFSVVSGPATIDGRGQLVATSGTGSVVVRATAVGDQNYNGAFADQTITLAKAGQNVNFTLPTTLTYNTGTGLSATALDSGTVSFSVVSGPATIDGRGQLVATSGTGSVVVRATAVGDQNYNGAFADQTITLQKAVQNLTASPILPRLTGSSGTIPIFGVMVGSPTFSILETDGRATVNSVGNVSVGKILGAASFTLRADAAGDSNYLVGQKDFTVNISRNIPAVEAANATRQFLILPEAKDLAALDEFFYYNGKATGYTGGPSQFYSDAGIGDTDRTLARPGVSTDLYSGQTWDFYASRKFSALPGSITVTPSAGKSEAVFYADSIDLGAVNPRWQGTIDPQTDSASMGYRYLSLNNDYLPVFLSIIDTNTGEPFGFTDPNGSYYFPLKNFAVWDDVGGSLLSTDLVQVDVTASRWTLAAGSGGIATRGLGVNANGAEVQMITSGDLNLKTVQVSDVGSGLSRDALTLEASGKVRMGTDATVDLNLDTNAGLAEGEQVRLEGRTQANGDALVGSMAVIRTGDSLELRNVTIRGFSETSLEKMDPTTKVAEGRVLISGSAVRDFKIKELVGAAVNADARIQMMALDGNGALAGDMVVSGKMPVQAKLASALAEAGETLPSATANAMVDAKQIDLAARNLKFDNANLVAMNLITARANTILVQNSFMTVVRNQGMINMYVQSGLVNTTYGSMVDGRANFAGLNQFKIGNTAFAIGNQVQLDAAYGKSLVDFTHNGGSPQVGKVNVLKL